MGIAADLQSLSPGTLLEFVEIDATTIHDAQGIAGSVHYFHNGTNEIQQDVVWQGNTYIAFPIQLEGFEGTTQGAIPRPTLTISNITALITGLTKRFNEEYEKLDLLINFSTARS